MAGKSKNRQGVRKIEIVLVLTFILVFASLSFAQTTTQPKIAIIFPEIFEDEKKGIRDLIEVNKKLEVEFKTTYEELLNLAYKIEDLEKELTELAKAIKGPGCGENLVSKYEANADKYKKLGDEFTKKQSAAKALYDKRKAELTVDIIKKIGAAVKQFSKEKGYALILDATKLELVSFDENLDVTQDFIKYYNENFGNTKTQ